MIKEKADACAQLLSGPQKEIRSKNVKTVTSSDLHKWKKKSTVRGKCEADETQDAVSGIFLFKCSLLAMK